jgi:hypothetical protein
MENFVYIKHATLGRQPFKAYPYQCGLIDTYHQNKNAIAMVSRQMGKALSLDTPILTPGGLVPMRTLSVGDTIYTPSGAETEITFITDVMYNRPCYEIEFSTGETIVADAEHLWSINTPTGRYETVTTLEMIEYMNHYKAWAKPASLFINHCNVIEFDANEVPLDPYLVGLWLGDGHTGAARITCAANDYEEYRGILSEAYEITEHRLDKRTANTGYFTIYNIVEHLRELGIFEHKTIPSEYIFNSEEVRLGVIQGLMDSDGYCEKNGTCQFYQSDESMALSFKFLLSTMGIKSTLRTKKTGYKDAYIVTFCTADMDVFRLSRKLTRQYEHRGHPKSKRIYIRNITEVDSVPVRCLQVDDPDHLFLCGNDLIPTHNTTVAAGYLLWYAIFNPDSTILIASNKHDNAKEIMGMIRYAYEDLPDYIRAGVTSYNKQSIDFDNGSRIISQATTENTGRGMALTLTYLDEFAFVEPRVAREFWTSLSPTLSTGGKCIITSTPNSDEDQFAELWFGALDNLDEYGNPQKKGRNGFVPFHADWREHPDRDEKWAEEERNKIGDERFRREHMVEFVAFEETLIGYTTLASLKGKTPIRTSGQVRWYKNIDKSCRYAISLDPAMGSGGDYAAIQVLELPTLTQVAEWQSNTMLVEQQLGVLRDIGLELLEHGAEEIYWTVENNSLGEAALVVVREMGEERFPGTMVHDHVKAPGKKMRRGFNTTAKNKIEACSRLKTWLETGRLKISSANLIGELKTFVAKGATYQAKVGCYDDLIMALVLAIRMTEAVSRWDDDTYDAIMTMVGDDSEYERPMPIGFL